MNLPILPQDAARELLTRRQARSSFATFCKYTYPDEPPAKHHLLICDACDRIVSGELTRVLIMMPPGSAKSSYATVRFPAYYLGRMGAKGVITASYGDTLAERFGGKVRNLVRTPEYSRLFPGLTLAADSQAKGEWETSAAGFYFATGIGGGVTGRRADLAVIDDPIRGRKDADSELVRDNAWNWYIDDLRTRLKPGAAIMLIQTRWHMDDLAGRILPETWDGESGWVTARDGERWYVISVPAQAGKDDLLGRAPGEWLWTDWFDEAFWEQTKKTALLHDVRTWNSLYQQVPADEAGTYFQRAWFQRYAELPQNLNVYMSGDFAVSEGEGDFTELAVWGVDPHNRIFVLDWWYGQKDSEVWVAQLLAMKKRWDALHFVGEMGPIRKSVEPWLERSMRDTGIYVGCSWLPFIGDKTAGARSFQALAKLGMVHWPKSEWAERAINQLCKFPAGTRDDVVDTCALFGRYINSVWSPIEPEKPKEPVWDAPMRIADFMPKAQVSEW